MKRKFSDRIGVTKPNPIQLESINSSLRNSLWNLILWTVFSSLKTESNISRVRFITKRFLKLPSDEVPNNSFGARDWLKRIFYDDSAHWWYTYNFLEFLANHAKEASIYDIDRFTLEANRILEEESSGYRFIGGFLIPITNPSEIGSIINAIEASHLVNLFGAEKHLNTALDLLSKKPNPDYRNSVKESISAIESLVKQITSEDSGGLDKALNKLDTKVKFHGAFKSGLLSLYGYTSDEDGIRHAILEEPGLSFDEAKFMLVACSALVNLIIAKANKHGLLPT